MQPTVLFLDSVTDWQYPVCRGRTRRCYATAPARLSERCRFGPRRSRVQSTAPKSSCAGPRAHRTRASSSVASRSPSGRSAFVHDGRSSEAVVIARPTARATRVVGSIPKRYDRHRPIWLEGRSRRWWRGAPIGWAFAVLCGLMQSPHFVQAQSAPGADGRCVGDWSVVDRDTQPGILISNAQVTQWRGRIVAVGDPALVWRADSGHQLKSGNLIGAVVWDLSGARELLKPFANGIVMYPRAATASDGILHVVFGTRTDLTNRDWTTAPDTLWHVTYDGVRWSAPDALPNSTSGPYWWENISPSALIVSGRELDIAVPIKSRDDSVIALLHRNSAGHWSLHHLATGGAAATYVRLARIGRVLLLIWSAADPKATETDRNSVFAARSFDNGVTWTRAIRLHLSGLRGTYDHTLLLDATGRGFVLWTQQSTDRARPPDTLGISMTSDTGRTWRVGTALAVPGGFGTFEAGLSAWGPVAIFQPIGSSGSRMAVLKDNRWIEQELRPGLVSSSGVPALSLSPTSIALVSTVQREQQPGSEKTQANVTTRLFMLTIHCSP